MESVPKNSDPFKKERQTQSRMNQLLLENQQLEKRIAHIESSKLWKLGLIANKFKQLLNLGKLSSKKTPLNEAPLSLDRPVNESGLKTGESQTEWVLEPRTKAMLDIENVPLEALHQRDKGILFLVPFKGQGGGMHSIYQEVKGLNQMGFRAAIAADLAHRDHFQSLYPDQSIFLYFQEKTELVRLGNRFKVMIATYFKSVSLLQWIVTQQDEVQCGYYVQDYEPWFFQGGSEWERIAFRTYGSIPQMTHFAKTEFLASTLWERHGIQCHLVPPSLDHSIFQVPKSMKKEDPPMVVAMVRPQTPWRRPKLTLEVFAALNQRLGRKVSLHTFGCEKEQLNRILEDPHLDIFHHGKLSSEEVANLFQKASVFVDLSIYQGFGRTGLEAMACGCIPVLPEKSGPETYAVQGKNALLINTGDADVAIEAVDRLVKSKEMRMKMAQAGIQTAAKFSVQKTAIAEFLLFHRS